MKWLQFKKAVGYVLINFATPMAFYITFNKIGAKPAIGLAIAVTCIQLLAHRIYGVRPTPFFMIASGFTVGFGTIDLFLRTPKFFRLEPSVQNFIIGTVLLISLLMKYPLAKRFAEALPSKLRPDLTFSGESYLRRLTWVWVVYLYLKAGIFLYLAFTVDLGRLIILRTVIGGGSLALLFVGEVIYRQCLKRT